MTEDEKDKAKAAAAAGVGAGVGGAGGATVGILELAAQGTVTGVSSGLMIGLGAIAGGLLAYGVYYLQRQYWKVTREDVRLSMSGQAHSHRSLQHTAPGRGDHQCWVLGDPEAQ